ncbi:MAG TPA: hypothetical protein VF868_13395 [Bacteroidia bacterium]|jgi:hypothetical protein
MKNAQVSPAKQANKGTSKKARPENKDNLDSRQDKVKGKDNTAKKGKDDKVKTKNPGKQAAKKESGGAGNKTPKKPAKKASKKK